MRIVVSTTEKYWVWGELDVCQEVASERAAVKLLSSFKTERYESKGVDGQVYSRPHHACKVLKAVWNAPLPEGFDHHKSVLSPVVFYREGSAIVKKMARLPPSHITRAKGAQWWRDQYQAGLCDPTVQELGRGGNLFREV